jgi:hypothetical protein
MTRHSSVERRFLLDQPLAVEKRLAGMTKETRLALKQVPLGSGVTPE